MPHVKAHPAVVSAGAPKRAARTYKGHRVLTLEDAAQHKPLLPPEPEWQEELQHLERQHAAKAPAKTR